MLSSPERGHGLWLQAVVLIMLSCCLLLSSGGLILELLPHFTVPPWLRLRFEGSVAITLTGASMAAVVLDSRGWRLGIGSLVAVFGSYNLGHNLLAGSEDSGYSWLTGRQRLPVVPATLITLVAICCLVGVKSTLGRVLWRTVAVLSLFVGLLVMAAYLNPAIDHADWLRYQLLPLGAIFSVILAISLGGIAAQRTHPILRLHRSAVAVGILGVILSMLWWFLGSWGQYGERLQAAEVQVKNFAAVVEHEIDSQVSLMRRMAGRWQVIGGVPDDALKAQDVGSYFRDSPALLAVAFQAEGAQPLWHEGRNPQAERWLRRELESAPGQAWRQRFDAGEHPVAWLFPDPDKPQMALLVVRPEPGVHQYMLAALDIDALVSNQARQDAGEFELALSWSEGSASIPPSRDSGLLQATTMLATAVVTLADGPDLQLVARAGPPAFATLNNLLPIGGGLFGLLLTYQLITGRALVHRLNEQARALRTSEQRLRILERSLEASSNAVIVADARRPGFPVIYVNPAFSRITDYAAASVLGEKAEIFLTGRYVNAEDSALIAAALADKRALSITLRNRRRNGSPFWNQLALAPVRDAEGIITHFVGVLNDISERKEQESRLAYQATHDALTGLANRSLFNDRLAHDFALARRRRQVLAVLFIDLDEFKPINDTLGHKVGDELLVSVTDRLVGMLRPSDTLARLGGDEFVLLLPDLRLPGQAEEVAERLLLELARPHRIAGHELYISASIGIAVINDDMQNPEKLIQHSDMAMYQAKQQGRNTYQLFTADMDATLSRRVSLRNELQEALDANQLELYYQPLLDVAGRMDGMEALVRWFHPVHGAIAPSVFIPIAEETGQIIQLSRWVMERACRDAVVLQRQGLLRGKLAVNLSPMQFHRPSFMSTLRDILRGTGLAPDCLELELTEGILMHDTDRAIEILHELAAIGISTAIDDFGTGYSSLSYIRTLPVGKIKLDGSFVRGVIDNRKDAAVCKGIIAMARELQLRVVAEGVETHAQFEYLKSHGCEVFQGFLFAHPMPLAAVSVWLRAQSDTQAITS